MFLCLLALLNVRFATGEVVCRDRYLEPFSSDSIWNTAIGSEAEFAPANLYADASNPLTNVHNDQDFFLRVTEEDPLVDWVSQGDWGVDNHCAATGDVVTQIRLPTMWTTSATIFRSVSASFDRKKAGV